MNLLPPILLVDDDPDDRELASLVLTGAFGEVALEPVADAGVLTRALSSRRYGLVITEFRLGWIDGAEVVRLARELRPDCAVVLFTCDLNPEVVEEAIRLGVDGFVAKSSAGFSRLPVAVRSALYRARRRALDTAKEAPYRGIFEGLPVGVFVATADGEILEANPRLASILGFASPEELTRRSLRNLFIQESVADRWRSTLERAGSIEGFEADLRRGDGEAVRVRFRASFVGGEVAGSRQLLGLLEEAAEAGTHHEELALRSAQLAESHDELEQMVYVVSHDLQQPINVVGRFLDLLADRDGDSLSDTGAEYLEHAISGAANLQRMVDAVLRYSRIDTTDQHFEAVDCNRVRDKVLAVLAEEIEATGAQINSDDLPTVMADEAQMELLFQNLLSNALKFRGARPVEILITAEERSGEWLMAVTDNGIGIDPKSADRIFMMFQRLHTQEEFPGTGIGLAVCKRIVVRHGGRIWLESRPGRGTTFYISLPKRNTGSGEAEQ